MTSLVITFTGHIRWIWIILYIWVRSISGVEVKEYCRFDTFHAQCASDEVIVMTSAKYGRMGLGQCLKKGYGVLNCSTDVTDHMNALCSGTHTCEISFLTGTLGKHLSLECLGDLTAHAKASYKCQKVAALIPGRCKIQTSDHEDKNNLIPNIITQEASCGSSENPLIIEAKPMQRINISLIDFGTYRSPTNKNKNEPGCIHYGTLKDNSGTQETLCGGSEKEKYVFLSKGNRVEITMATPETISERHFLLNYTVIGCPEPDIPSAMWMKREGSHMLVGCYTSRATWRLECEEEKWIGTIGNCTVETKTPRPSPIHVDVVREDIIDEELATEDFNNEIGIAAAVVTSVFLSILLLVIGLLYDRRKGNLQQNGHAPLVDVNSYSQNGRVGLDTLKKMHPPSAEQTIKSNEGTMGNTEDWLHSNTFSLKPANERGAQADRTSDWCQNQRPPSHFDHIYDTPNYFDLDPDYVGQNSNSQFATVGNRPDSYLQPGDNMPGGPHLNTLGNRPDSYVQPLENGGPALL